MAETLGLAAGVLQVAEFGAKVGSVLWTCAKKIRHADKELRDLAAQVEATSKCLRGVGSLLDDPDTKALHTAKLYDDTSAVSKGCHEVFLELDKAAKKINDGKPKMSMVQRLQWPLNSDKLTEPLKILKNYNDVLHLMLTVLQIVEGRRAATSDELRVLGESLQRLTVSNESLSQSNKALTDILFSQKQDSQKTDSGLPGPSPSTPARGLDTPTGSPFVSLIAIPEPPKDSSAQKMQPKSTDVTHHRLQRCMDSVQELANTIACAMSSWQGQQKSGSSDIHGAHDKVVAELGKLSRELRCSKCSGKVSWADFDLCRAASSSLGTCTCEDRTSSSLWTTHRSEGPVQLGDAYPGSSILDDDCSVLSSSSDPDRERLQRYRKTPRTVNLSYPSKEPPTRKLRICSQPPSLPSDALRLSAFPERGQSSGVCKTSPLPTTTHEQTAPLFELKRTAPPGKHRSLKNLAVKTSRTLSSQDADEQLLSTSFVSVRRGHRKKSTHLMVAGDVYLNPEGPEAIVDMLRNENMSSPEASFESQAPQSTVYEMNIHTGVPEESGTDKTHSAKPPSHLQKRRRVSRACDECKRKKIKCDGKQPCTHCTVYSYECTHDQPSNRRRYSVPQYVENIEHGVRPPPWQSGKDVATVENDASSGAIRLSSTVNGRSGSQSSRKDPSSSNASEQRDSILDLANPERTPVHDAESRRQQKHPAAFQCHLCPKRFTRAYNLRSHLRTHPDERPFVCRSCGETFAREHDLQRHRGLHSTESSYAVEKLVSLRDEDLKPGSRVKDVAVEPSSVVQALLSRWLGDSANTIFGVNQD